MHQVPEQLLQLLRTLSFNEVYERQGGAPGLGINININIPPQPSPTMAQEPQPSTSYARERQQPLGDIIEECEPSELAIESIDSSPPDTIENIDASPTDAFKTHELPKPAALNSESIREEPASVIKIEAIDLDDEFADDQFEFEVKEEPIDYNSDHQTEAPDSGDDELFGFTPTGLAVVDNTDNNEHEPRQEPFAPRLFFANDEN